MGGYGGEGAIFEEKVFEMNTNVSVIMSGFNCPEYAAIALQGGVSKMLQAILSLGCKRVQWIGGTINKDNHVGLNRSQTMWSLDGKRATVGQILRAAR